MGTDIHWFVERRTARGAWKLLDGDVPFFYPDDSPLVYKARNYELFGALAGVRGVTPQQLPTRGLPEDACLLTVACKDADPDCVGHSWATLKELSGLVKESFSEPVFVSVIQELSAAAKLGEIRVVFWFDR